MLNKGNTTILISRNEEKFEGTNIAIGQFWYDSRDKILKVLFEENKENSEYDTARQLVLEKLDVTSIEEYYDSLDEKKVIKSAKICVAALQTCLTKGYLIEKDITKYPSYKEFKKK